MPQVHNHIVPVRTINNDEDQVAFAMKGWVKWKAEVWRNLETVRVGQQSARALTSTPRAGTTHQPRSSRNMSKSNYIVSYHSKARYDVHLLWLRTFDTLCVTVIHIL